MKIVIKSSNLVRIGFVSPQNSNYGVKNAH